MKRQDILFGAAIGVGIVITINLLVLFLDVIMHL
tara:strand:- start:313 stop:414 length:102 start_codon:yes stop_codon:yes gene_type:complete